jgi:large subunit ribosomal protein L4
MAIAHTYSKTGAKHESTVTLNDAIFGLDASHELVAQAYRTYLANGRTAAASTLKRGEVRGGGKKPWRQKGTGRARVGSIRVPNWRGGGVVFGPTGNENFTINMPVKMKRAAIRQTLSLKAEAKSILVIDEFITDGKVKSTAEFLGKLGLTGNILLVINEKNDMIIRGTRNLTGLTVVSGTYLNVFTLMNADHIVFTKDALDTVNGWLAPELEKEEAK